MSLSLKLMYLLNHILAGYRNENKTNKLFWKTFLIINYNIVIQISKIFNENLLKICMTKKNYIYILETYRAIKVGHIGIWNNHVILDVFLHLQLIILHIHVQNL